ncbi:vitamin D3 receptor-like [Mercenaria mercenaria]|uniref:vitamin D3 receptor-like n=1 Tax=Mercenaria mercenaria TaxID=6596 RepID=UPI00234F6649|nr:vitamin D3 receptor-like [Mercenaria mercenaria]
MDNGKNVVKACSVLKASHCSSLEDTNHDFRQNSTVFAMYEKDTKAIMPLSSLDLLTSVLPPTPEDSLSVALGHDEGFLFEDIIAESSTPGNIPSILNCRADLDLYFPVDVQLQPHVDTMLSSHPSSQTKQADEQTVVQFRTIDSQTQTFFPEEVTKAQQTVSFSETNVNNESEIYYQNECTDSAASGSHYGAITCEACKGFFRRYLQKKKEFKCTKGGKCEISSGKKGNCSGCRLKKCLALGMSKEMSKLGRYTLAKRTEAFINMKRLEGNEACDSVTDESVVLVETGSDANSCNLEKHVIMRHLVQNTKTANMSGGFSDMLVVELVQAMEELEPYGPNVKTKEQINEQHIHQSERYKLKTELFGKMNRIPKDEYDKLYKEFGIDIDGRIADMKIEYEDIEDDMARYCNFAKHIPEFYNLPLLDQSNLLKASLTDFYIVVMVDAYNDELRTIISKNGHGYHFDEMADREYSAKLLSLMKDVFCRLQNLDLSKSETALLAALTLVSTDRCKLQNRALVEKIQLAITELLQLEIKKKQKQAARSRFTKIIDSLTYMREMSDVLTKENNLLFKDEVLIQEFPFLVDFIIEEN